MLYSSAFLRLGHVTQVASPEIGHIFHSRLTHSLKVGQVSRRIAERLEDQRRRGAGRRLVEALDPDAVEAAALAHDLGHPPFGHLAEQELESLAHGFGGFEGNAQSFRIVTRLSLRSFTEPGLNLTRQTLNGLLKYPWIRDTSTTARSDKYGAYDADAVDFRWAREGSPTDMLSLEARIMDWADDVTYAVHDMDDFYRAGLVPLERLSDPDDEEFAGFADYVRQKDGSETAAAAKRVFAAFPLSVAYDGRAAERVNLRALGSFLITRYINAFRVVTEGGDVFVRIEPQIEQEVAVLKRLTWYYIIERPSLATLQEGQRKVIRGLFELYAEAVKSDELRMFPPAFAERLAAAETDDARKRVITDLIASLSEDSAVEIYRRASGVTTGSLLFKPRI